MEKAAPVVPERPFRDGQRKSYSLTTSAFSITTGTTGTFS